jgi:hypothetical protein
VSISRRFIGSAGLFLAVSMALGQQCADCAVTTNPYTADYWGDDANHYLVEFASGQALPGSPAATSPKKYCSRLLRVNVSGADTHNGGTISGIFPGKVLYTFYDGSHSQFTISGKPAVQVWFEWQRVRKYVNHVLTDTIEWGGQSASSPSGSPDAGNAQRTISSFSAFDGLADNLRSGGSYRWHMWTQNVGTGQRYTDWVSGDFNLPERSSGDGWTTSQIVAMTGMPDASYWPDADHIGPGTGSTGSGSGGPDASWFQNLMASLFEPSPAKVDGVKQKLTDLQNWGPFMAMNEIADIRNWPHEGIDQLPTMAIRVPKFEMLYGTTPFWHFTNEDSTVIPLPARPLSDMPGSIRNVLGLIVYAAFIGGLVKWLMPKQVV